MRLYVEAKYYYYPEDHLVLNFSIIGIQSHNYNSHGGVNNTVTL